MTKPEPKSSACQWCNVPCDDVLCEACTAVADKQEQARKAAELDAHAENTSPLFIPMKKRMGERIAGRKRKGLKAYKTRRRAIERGEYSRRSRFGRMGDSSWWW